jgi:hypothetical protein
MEVAKKNHPIFQFEGGRKKIQSAEACFGAGELLAQLQITSLDSSALIDWR